MRGRRPGRARRRPRRSPCRRRSRRCWVVRALGLLVLPAEWSRHGAKGSREPSGGWRLHSGGGARMTQSTFPPVLEAPRVALRIGLGLAAFLAGLDKFVGLLADWPGYLAPVVAGMLPVSPEVFMRAVGVIEMIVGLAILTRWTREGAW